MIHNSEKNDLIIDYSKVIGYPCLLKITPWEKGITWTSIAGQERVIQKNYLDETGLTLHQTYNDNKENNWLRAIPKDLLGKLLDYEKKYFFPVYPLLCLLSNHQSAIDLFKRNHLLMAILMYSAKVNNWNEEYVVNLLNGKRIDLINACGLPRRESTLKTLDKIRGVSLTPLEYLTIKNVLSLPNADLINNFRYVDIKLIYLIEEHNDLLTKSLMQSYHKEWSVFQFKKIYFDTTIMLGRAANPQLIKCLTISALEKIHERWTIKRDKKVYFPQPPIKGSKYIIPITNSHELIDEGRAQHHCVAGYKDEIVNGRSYIYKVLEPERGTLQVLILANNKYARAQFKLSCHQSPSKETIRIIDQWINGND
ncbi:MAG: PcfJ domain-containing protein [Thiotrichaceae bacterium]|nr:PcfJ domain-containing protein [Thiotrichaceae bacterium]